MQLLEAEKIKAAMSPELWKLIPGLHILNRIDSTNTYVLNYCKSGVTSGFTCLAEEQTAGRGRWGRTWISPFASHLYLSMLWKFPKQLSDLSLVIALTVANTLKQLGISEKIGLKWPNDIYWEQNKLAGILIETSPPNNTVIGIGLNVKMPESIINEIDQPWTDLHKILGTTLDRNIIAGLLISELLTILPHFSKHGFAPFSKDWQALNTYYLKNSQLGL